MKIGDRVKMKYFEQFLDEDTVFQFNMSKQEYEFRFKNNPRFCVLDADLQRHRNNVFRVMSIDKFGVVTVAETQVKFHTNMLEVY